VKPATFQHAAPLATSAIVGSLVALTTLILLAPKCSPESLLIYFNAQVWLVWGTAICNLGYTKSSLQHSITQNRKHARICHLLAGSLSLLSPILAWLLVASIGDTAKTWWPLAISLLSCIFPTTLITTQRTALYKTLKTKTIRNRQFLSTALGTAALLSFVLAKNYEYALASHLVVTRWTEALLTWITARKTIPTDTPNKDLQRDSYWPLYLNNLARTAGQRYDIYLAALLLPTEWASGYALCRRLFGEITNLLETCIANISLVQLVQTTDEKMRQKIAGESIQLSLWIILPFCLGGLIISPLVPTLLKGEVWKYASDCAPFILLQNILYAAHIPFNQWIIAEKKETDDSILFLGYGLALTVSAWLASYHSLPATLILLNLLVPCLTLHHAAKNKNYRDALLACHHWPLTATTASMLVLAAPLISPLPIWAAAPIAIGLYLYLTAKTGKRFLAP
jgi:O-antigen/teichoic acid export membrane protein